MDQPQQVEPQPPQGQTCICCTTRRARRGWDGAGPVYCTRCDKLVNEKGYTHQRALQEIEAREGEGATKPERPFDFFRGPAE